MPTNWFRPPTHRPSRPAKHHRIKDHLCLGDGLHYRAYCGIIVYAGHTSDRRELIANGDVICQRCLDQLQRARDKLAADLQRRCLGDRD